MGIDLTGKDETNWMARGRDSSRGASLSETEETDDAAEPDSEDADGDADADADAEESVDDDQ